MRTRIERVCPTCGATSLRHLSYKTRADTVTESAYCTDCGTRLTLEYELKKVHAEPVDADSDPGLALTSRHVWDVCHTLETNWSKRVLVGAGTRDENGRWPMADLPESDSVSVRARLFRKKDPADAPQAKPEYLVEAVSAKRRMIAYLTGLERGARHARYTGGGLRIKTHVLFERIEAEDDGSLALHGCEIHRDGRRERHHPSHGFDEVLVSAPEYGNKVRTVEARRNGRRIDRFRVSEGDDFLYTAFERLFEDEERTGFDPNEGMTEEMSELLRLVFDPDCTPNEGRRD